MTSCTPKPSFRLLWLALCCATAAQAQTPPDAGALLRDATKGLDARPLPQAVPSIAGDAARPADTGGVRVTVQRYELQGVTLLPVEEVQAVLTPWVGRPVTIIELRNAAEAVAQLYQQRGLLARASLPSQTLDGGVVTVVVTEARFGALRIERAEGSHRLDDAGVRRIMLARQREGQPVRTDDLQRAIGLLDETPGVSASSVLQPGTRDGESDLVVRVQDEAALAGAATLDNHGSRATGAARLTLAGSANSPLGLGDQAQVLLNHSTGSDYLRVGYSLPLGGDGWRLAASLSWLDYGYELSGNRYEGSAGDLDVTLSYPVLRGTTANLAVALAHERKRFNNEVGGVAINDKDLVVSRVNLTGDRIDALFGGGMSQGLLQLSSGRLDLSGNAGDSATDRAAGGPGRAGQFNKLVWSYARLQRLGVKDNLMLSLGGQFADANLDSAEKFGATGVGAVRAYASTEASGDQGRSFGLEWRHQYSAEWQASAFFDHARVHRDRRVVASSPQPNVATFRGVGIGASWFPTKALTLRASLAWRLGDNPLAQPATGLDSDGTRRQPRFWLSLSHTL